MANQFPDDALEAIEAIVRDHPAGLSAAQIQASLPEPIAPRTLQYRLRHLVNEASLVRESSGRWARYRVSDPTGLPPTARSDARSDVPLTPAGLAVRDAVRQPLSRRRPVGYDPGFLTRYEPNRTFYLTTEERAHLAEVGQQPTAPLPAGTFAQRILARLLIDLSWNSSRLEGNTYTLLDTQRLIDFGVMAEGHTALEARMILNHKEAIEFLVGSAGDIGFDRYTILNVHALLAQDLLADPAAAGRLRHISVGTGGSVFHPLDVPQQIDEGFNRLLRTAAAIQDPFEKAFFVMVQLPYLQPFDDVNKRVSRLAANIPFIQKNLTPLSFTEVPAQTYVEALLGVYELQDVALCKEVYVWAYERSALRYAAVRQSIGEPDPFRIRYREPLSELIARLVRERVPRIDVIAAIRAWVADAIPPEDAERFAVMAEAELLNLHEGNIARYRLRRSEWFAWQADWDAANERGTRR